MKEKKQIGIELYNDIDDIVEMQRYIVNGLKNTPDKRVLHLQEDILKIVEAARELASTKLN